MSGPIIDQPYAQWPDGDRSIVELGFPDTTTHTPRIVDLDLISAGAVPGLCAAATSD